MLATNPAPVVVHRLPRFWFVLPMTLPTIRFGDIGPNDGLAERLQGVIAVVSLVGDRLDRSLRVHPFAHLFIISGAGDLGDMLPPGEGFPGSLPCRPRRPWRPSLPPPRLFPDPPHARPCRPSACARPSAW